MDRPVVYEIQVRGLLQAAWAEWFEGLSITSGRGTDGMPVTTLTGRVADQARLHGILARIRDLNLELIALQRVKEGHHGHHPD